VSEQVKLNKPWMIAVWPGMGHVSMSAGYYLIAKLGMHLFAEFRPLEMFDVEHVEVKDGLVHTARLPRSRVFVWNDPAGGHDLVVFIGEAQPPLGKYAFCHRLLDFARELGVERLFTFAAMATAMRPGQPSHVYGAAADQQSLADLKQFDLQIIEEGYIGGLNGVALGVAVESGFRGACLLGEMPQVFAQLPYPHAALAVLEVFVQIAGLELDLDELRQQAESMDGQLDELLTQIEQAMGQQQPAGEDVIPVLEPEEPKLTTEDQQRIERLFQQAAADRSKAYELKRELDRLEVFRDYEDRFLDLFKRPS
jgi:uncharacterized protein